MPIVGLTDTKTVNPVQALPVLARVHKGGPRPEDGRGPGPDLDYFRVEFLPRYAHLRETWEQLYGAQPHLFPRVYLPGSRTEDVFTTWNEEWTKTKLLHRCDGKTQVRHYDPARKEYVNVPTPCAGNCKCRQIGRLYMVLPDLIGATGLFGLVILTTHSLLDIKAIHAALVYYEAQFDGLQGVELAIGRDVQKVPIPIKKADGSTERVMTDKSMIYVRLGENFVRTEMMRRVTTLPQRALPAPAPQQSTRTVDPATGEVSYGEASYPDNRGAQGSLPPVQQPPAQRQQTAPSTERKASPPRRISGSVINWKQPPASNLVPDVRKLVGNITPIDLFTALDNLTAAGHIKPAMLPAAPAEREAAARKIASLIVAHLSGALALGGEIVDEGSDTRASERPAGDEVIDGEVMDIGDETPDEDGGAEAAEGVPLGWPADLAAQGITPDNFKVREDPIGPMDLYNVVCFLKPDGIGKKASERQTNWLKGLIKKALVGRPDDMVDAARTTMARFFFGKDIDALDMGEATALIGVLTDGKKNLHPCAEVEVAQVIQFAESVSRAEAEGA